jgi:hypothetical protein
VRRDAFTGAGAPADQRRIGGLLQVFEPLLETVELPGDPELRIDGVCVDACLASLEDELRRGWDVLEVSQLARDELQLLALDAQALGLRRFGCCLTFGGRVVLIGASRRVDREQHGTKENRFAQHRLNHVR